MRDYDDLVKDLRATTSPSSQEARERPTWSHPFLAADALLIGI